MSLFKTKIHLTMTDTPTKELRVLDLNDPDELGAIFVYLTGARTGGGQCFMDVEGFEYAGSMIHVAQDGARCETKLVHDYIRELLRDFVQHIDAITSDSLMDSLKKWFSDTPVTFDKDNLREMIFDAVYEEPSDIQDLVHCAMLIAFERLFDRTVSICMGPTDRHHQCHFRPVGPLYTIPPALNFTYQLRKYRQLFLPVVKSSAKR